ncbi:hypothetical protein M408DRAFT_124317 [Serendipita vermifera MAFF 305830]|uniref:Uncharacterized protein n=1 Tax=Serendipita vermifera MAFF 305830 TaxID=933852 RepID=A0A0C3AN72_SERVB|nr:hypothetical protein M408DRAFT_124317 [Serendipita vermifera MAFF 305830]
MKPQEVTPAASNGTKPTETDDLRQPTRHRPVISTILRLTNDTHGKKVRLHDIVSALQLDYPRAKQEFLTELVDEAEKNGVLIRERDFFGIIWIYLAVPILPADPPPPPTPTEPPAPQGPAPPPNTTNHSTPKNNDQVLNSGEPLKDAKCQIEISHYPLKYKPVIAALLKVTEGKLETKVRLSLIEHALRMEYPRAKHEFLHALILEAEEGGVLVREIGRADIGWVSLLPPGSGESATVGTSQPPPSPQPNDKWNPLSPTPHDTNPPRPNSLNPSPLPSAFRSPSPHNKTSSFSGPSPVTPNGMLSVQDYPSKHHAVVSALIKLTHGYRGVKVRMSDITKELQLVHHGETPCFPFSLITKAEADNILLRERDGSGMFWVSLRDPLPSEAIPSPPAKNATSSNKFEPLVSAVSHLCDGKRDILVDFEAVGKQLGEREEITQDMEQHKVVCETNSTSYRSKASSEELIGPGNAHSVAVPPPLPNEEERMMALGSVTLESRNMVSLEPPVLLANPPVNQEFIAELTVSDLL